MVWAAVAGAASAARGFPAARLDADCGGDCADRVGSTAGVEDHAAAIPLEFEEQAGADLSADRAGAGGAIPDAGGDLCVPCGGSVLHPPGRYANAAASG